MLEKRGVRAAAISYDSREVLAAFAGKHSIGYPLLADAGSQTIRKFGIFNFNMAPELRAYGVPHPVEYLVAPDGVVVNKFFVPNYQHRVTASAVALREFGELAGDSPAVTLQSGALTAQIGFPSGRAFSGQEVSFLARFALQPGWHVYGASISFSNPELVRQSFQLREELPLYEGAFDGIGTLLLKHPLPEGALILRGQLQFQQCSQTVCEPPETIAFQLPLTLQPFLISERDQKLR